MSQEITQEDVKFYWFSFSLKGENQGVCLIEADNPEEANQKVIDLGLNPEHDHSILLGLAEKEELSLNRLYTPKELKALGFENVKS